VKTALAEWGVMKEAIATGRSASTPTCAAIPPPMLMPDTPIRSQPDASSQRTRACPSATVALPIAHRSLKRLSILPC